MPCSPSPPHRRGAITNGAPDGNGHPEVGALLAQQAYSDGTWEECTGTLISPTVFLTAAHCDEGVSRVAVTFDSTYTAPKGTTYWGTWHADPAYNQAQSDPHDIAVVVLDKAVKGITPGAAADGRLARHRRHDHPVHARSATAARRSTRAAGRKTFSYADVRYVATGTLNSLTPSWLRISMNPSTGNGGTCYGDSGGPNFLGAGATETNIVAGDDDHRRHVLPLDERRLPARHAVGAELPGAVRDAAVAP